MPRFSLDEELCQRAFDLAHFLHPDRTTAFRIVLAASGKLHVATSAQKKRLYYTPRGRNLPHRGITKTLRSKVSASEHLLLQRLVYIESEYHERKRDEARDRNFPTEDDLLVYYIKHLVRIALRRNSFYLTLGLSRLLYSYTTTAAMEIYSVMVQDPDRVKDDYYFRSRKAVLLRELKERFGSLLNTCRGPHGEEKIDQFAPDERQQKLVYECLSLFTPWGTKCTLPQNFDAAADEIAALSGGNQDEENEAELNRLHSVLHPECFKRVVDALKLSTPDTKLKIPNFMLSKQSDNGGAPGNRRPPRLSAEELSTLQKELEEQAARRKKSALAWLRVCVDGSEQVRFTAHKHDAQFLVNDGDELLELYGFDNNSGEELLFATQLLNWISNGIEPLGRSISLPQGNSICISATRDASGEPHRATINVSFKEARSLRAATDYLTNLISGPRVRWAPIALGVLAIVVLILFSNTLIRKIRPNNPVPDQQAVITPDKGATPTANESPSPEQRLTTQDQSTPQKRMTPGSLNRNAVSERSVAGNDTGVSAQPDSQPEITRGTPPEIVVKPLSDISTIHIVIEGDKNSGLSSLLTEKLRQSGRFRPTDNSDTADAHLNLTVQSARKADQLSATVRLINARREVVWPTGQARYAGSPSTIVDAIVRDLLDAVLKGQR